MAEIYRLVYKPADERSSLHYSRVSMERTDLTARVVDEYVQMDDLVKVLDAVAE